MKKTIQKIFIRLVALTLLLVVSNIIYTTFFFEEDLQNYSPMINDIRKVVDEKAEIVYLGESSNFTFRDDDIDKRSISSFIGDYFPTLKLGTIQKPASHANIYYHFLSQIPDNSTVKTIIVTLNLRSFNADWINSDLETPLQKEVLLLHKNYPPIYNRFLLSFKGYGNQAEQQRKLKIHYKWAKDKISFSPNYPSYKNTTDWYQAVKEKGIYINDTLNYDLTVLAETFVKSYGFTIHPENNPRIKDFDNIVKLAQKKGWKLIFNLMAENTEMADSLVGHQLTYVMKNNRDLLVNRYQKKGVIVVDNLEAVKSELYIDQDWTTEHYAEEGRKIIARNVAKELKAFYPLQYMEVKQTNEKKSSFFNTMESDLVWQNMNTITNEKAYSGKHSSKIESKLPYSISLEYPVNHIKDSLQHIRLSFQMLTHKLNDQMKVVISYVGGDTIDDVYFSLEDQYTTMKKWEKIQFETALPENFYKKRIIKVFVWNPSLEPLYVDDLKIDFY